MTLRSRGRLDAATTVLLAVSFGFALFGSGLFHTDDGCAVELHCFACNWSLASTGIAALLIAPDPAPQRTGDVVLPESPLPADARTAELSSRGPPSA